MHTPLDRWAYPLVVKASETLNKAIRKFFYEEFRLWNPGLHLNILQMAYLANINIIYCT